MPSSHPPGSLRPIEFEILLTLAAGIRHGYAIIQETEARANGTSVETATLYRALRRLVAAGLIRAAAAPPGTPAVDERRRYYAITTRGQAAAQTEAARLARLVNEARNVSLLPHSGRGL